MFHPTRKILLIRIAITGCAAAALPLPGLAASPGPVATVTTAPVVNATLADPVALFGEVRADPDFITSLAVARAGLITQVAVRPGERVNKGDTLLKLVTAPDAYSQFLQAQAAADYAQSQLASVQRLYKEQLATNAQLQAAQRDLHNAKAQLQALQRTGNGQASAVFRSSAGGVVTAVNVSQGQRVAAGTVVTLLAQQAHLIVVLGAEPEVARRLKDGDVVTLVSIFDPDVTFDATVAQVHALVDATTRLVEVIVKVPDSAAPKLTLGTNIRAMVALDARGTLAVPRQALVRDGEKAVVFVVHNGQARRVPVKITQNNGAQVGVNGDLHAGDSVVTTGSTQLEDGMAVRDAAQ